MGARVMNLTGITSILLGLTAGVLFAIVLSKYQAIGRTDQVHLQTKRPTPAEEVASQNVYFILPEWIGKVFKNTSADSEVAHLVNRESKQGLFDPRLNSTFLYDREKILCFVIVDRHRIGTYGKSAKATWTKHCNKVIFLSSVSNRDIGTIGINLPEGKANSWARTKLALQFVYNRFKESEFRWIVKASHDTILVVENLRYLLFMHRANIPNYIGHVFSGPKSGGSAFALSKEGLALIKPTLKDYKPKFGGSADDLELEECLKLAGAVPGRQGKDADGVERFQMIIPDHKLPLNTEAFAALYWRYIRQPEKEGPECCSDYSISFHYISPNNMYLLEYMIYHMRPFGIGHYTSPANMDAILERLHSNYAAGSPDKSGMSSKDSEVNNMRNEVIRGRKGLVGPDEKGSNKAVHLME